MILISQKHRLKSTISRMCSFSKLICCILLLQLCFLDESFVSGAPSTNEKKEIKDEMRCDNTSFFVLLKKVSKHLNPFRSSERAKMQFFLYKRDFVERGRELFTDDDEALNVSGFDARHPTRIIIHGWMSKADGRLSCGMKNAYLSLAKSQDNLPLMQQEGTEESSANSSLTVSNLTDFNVIVCDWSEISLHLSYKSVVAHVDELGKQLAAFVQYLHMRAGLQFDDVYLIGHSLGAHIAGSAGKYVKPFLFNTIYALDPAAPKFRNLSDEYRLDSSDAKYVESIQTSSTLGFLEPMGHATFYPNFGKDQKKCYVYGCSHSRAHHYFTESITSKKGFWGWSCERRSNDVWIIWHSRGEYKMGGEPSIPKNGTFYVNTNEEPPYAMGRRDFDENGPV